MRPPGRPAAPDHGPPGRDGFPGREAPVPTLTSTPLSDPVPVPTPVPAHTSPRAIRVRRSPR
ncbi:hypothetical protein QFZ75_003246 [Streptomyces sp. V3I8]|nr:hypothetical protein [Streptomyces sp. V3I8]